MFEKEAEEQTKQYMNEHAEKYNCENTKLETDNYNAGLEQGYEEGFQKGAEFGYNKANEWHYVKDGDLPKDEKLCLIWCGEKDFNTAEYVRERFWDLCGGWLEVDEVIAWKEIVLPKEIE